MGKASGSTTALPNDPCLSGGGVVGCGLVAAPETSKLRPDAMLRGVSSYSHSHGSEEAKM